MTRIKPVILSGGAGTRLWPLSNNDRPKQFLALTGQDTMFQMTLQRTADDSMFLSPMVVANAAHQNLIAEQLSSAGIKDATMLLEPCARNTAPAIAIAALACDDPATPMLVMPSDHVVNDVVGFHRAIASAAPHVDAGWMVTFGIHAASPETGYGYIKAGKPIDDALFEVAQFIEKPNADKAQQMLAEGGYSWNGGIFMMRADSYLGALKKHAPAILDAAKKSMDAADISGNVIVPDSDSFAACPSDSIDYAVMEKAAGESGGQVAVVPVAMGWSDVGSWDALHDIAPINQAIIEIDGSGNYVRSNGARIHMAGIQNMIVVAAGDDIIITPRGESQNVKTIVEQLKSKGSL